LTAILDQRFVLAIGIAITHIEVNVMNEQNDGSKNIETSERMATIARASANESPPVS
jgi:hypothetical protein